METESMKRKNASRYPLSEFLLDFWAECAGPLSLLAVCIPAFFVALAWENRALAQQVPSPAHQSAAEQRFLRLEERVTRLEAQVKSTLDKPVLSPTREQMAAENTKTNQGWWFAAAAIAFLAAGTFFASWGVNAWKRRKNDRGRLNVRLSNLD